MPSPRGGSTPEGLKLRFSSDLDEVPGMDPEQLAALREQVRLLYGRRFLDL